ncbi:uncharacterized protein LOC103794490 [Callithrix jacchus]
MQPSASGPRHLPLHCSTEEQTALEGSSLEAPGTLARRPLPLTSSAHVAPACRSPACGSPACRSPACGSPVCGSPACRSPACRSPACRSPVCRSPACRSPACRSPVCRSPVCGSGLRSVLQRKFIHPGWCTSLSRAGPSLAV